MPELDGRGLLEAIKKHSPGTECIMVTAVNDARTAVQCLRQGAYDYLVKPVSEDDLVFAVKRAPWSASGPPDILQIERRAGSPRCSTTRTPSRGLSPACPNAAAGAQGGRAARGRATCPVLITGESGTGKELLAQGHPTSPAPRSRRPFLLGQHGSR
ncbi:MAG: response regulator [Desulfosudis oleivorans]|nr:response regulator [Desulfosudis oleivorans]